MNRMISIIALTCMVIILPQISEAGCKITIKASYNNAVNNPETGTPLEKIRLDFVESQVRNKTGWWKSLKKCSPSQLWIKKGQSASTACPLTFSCNANRRFRIKPYGVDANGKEVAGDWIYYPSQNSWSKDETTIRLPHDLGDTFK